MACGVDVDRLELARAKTAALIVIKRQVSESLEFGTRVVAANAHEDLHSSRNFGLMRQQLDLLDSDSASEELESDLLREAAEPGRLPPLCLRRVHIQLGHWVVRVFALAVHHAELELRMGLGSAAKEKGELRLPYSHDKQTKMKKKNMEKNLRDKRRDRTSKILLSTPST